MDSARFFDVPFHFLARQLPKDRGEKKKIRKPRELDVVGSRNDVQESSEFTPIERRQVEHR